MKLIYCESCKDMIRLTKEERSCECGKSWGAYRKDGLHADIHGPCYPVGVANWSLINAIQAQPESGMGKNFEAFIIPKKCRTVHHHSEES